MGGHKRGMWLSSPTYLLPPGGLWAATQDAQPLRLLHGLWVEIGTAIPPGGLGAGRWNPEEPG